MCDAEALWPFQPECWACPAEGSKVDGRAGSRVWAYVKPLRPVRGPAFITKTNINSGARVPLGSGSPDPRHLHNQQFQPSRADSSGEKGGCACCGASCPGPMLASGLAGPPQGLQPHRGDCAFIPVLLAPPPSSLRSHSGPGSQAERSASTAPATPRRRQPRKVPQSAALPSGHRCPLFPRSLPEGLPKRGKPHP